MTVRHEMTEECANCHLRYAFHYGERRTCPVPAGTFFKPLADGNVIMVEGRPHKRFADLQAGDEIEGLGVLDQDAWPEEVGRWAATFVGRSGVMTCQRDFYVPVKVKPKKWQRKTTFTETTENEALALQWRESAGKASFDGLAEYGEVIEL